MKDETLYFIITMVCITNIVIAFFSYESLVLGLHTLTGWLVAFGLAFYKWRSLVPVETIGLNE